MIAISLTYLSIGGKGSRLDSFYFPYSKIQWLYHRNNTSKPETSFSFLSLCRLYIQYMFDFEISKGDLIYHPRKGTIKSNWIKHPSYFYYCSIYNITSYCFSTVCLWCQWARDMRVTRLLSCPFQCQGMFLPQHWVLIPTRGRCVAEQPVHPRVCGCGSGHRACENRHTIIMLLSLTAPYISPLLVSCLFLYLKFTSFLWFWRSTKSILYSFHTAWSSNGGTAKRLNPVLS